MIRTGNRIVDQLDWMLVVKEIVTKLKETLIVLKDKYGIVFIINKNNMKLQKSMLYLKKGAEGKLSRKMRSIFVKRVMVRNTISGKECS